MKFQHHRACRLAAWLGLALLLTVISMTAAADAPGNPGIYTLNADFDEGTKVNINHNIADQLQLDSIPTPFAFIWVAASAHGTVVKIDTVTGALLGEYLTAPEGMGRDPSRTTVDGNGNVWAGNRAEASGGQGSVVHIGLLENGQCVDRNGNGVIDTSTGLGDIKPWPNTGGADTGGGVSTAVDECILLYVRLPNAPIARHVSVDANNDVWVGGYPGAPTTFHKLHGATGAILSSFSAASFGCGGYGGLIDGNGILWSASINQDRLLRYDPSGIQATTCMGVPLSYGLGLDANGFIWNTMWTWNTVVKISPGGVPQFQTPTGGNSSRGVVVTKSDNHVWIANSASNTVTRLNNNGILQATIPVGATPTGVAVDAAGKVWVANLGSDHVMRIDPATNAVDLTVSLGAGAGPYNYSDMTGSTLIAPPNTGTWTIVHDSTLAPAVWGKVTWTADVPAGGSLVVKVASSADGVTFGPTEIATNGGDLSVADGRYLKVEVTFTRSTTTDSDGDGIMDGPILYDLTILANRPPNCSAATPSTSVLWPINHKFVPVQIQGVTDPDGDVLILTVNSIYQDEPVDTYGDGRFTPDGRGVGTNTAEVRAERTGTAKVPGNGRFYHIAFTAADGYGATCTGEVQVVVPHDNRPGIVPVDEGALYDSTQVAP